MRFTTLIMARELSRSRYTHWPDKSASQFHPFVGSHWARPRIFVSISSRRRGARQRWTSPARNWRNRRASGKFRIRILFIHRGSTCTSISFRSGNRVLPRQRSSGIFKATPRTEINVPHWWTRTKIFWYISRVEYSLKIYLSLCRRKKVPSAFLLIWILSYRPEQSRFSLFINHDITVERENLTIFLLA